MTTIPWGWRNRGLRYNRAHAKRNEVSLELEIHDARINDAERQSAQIALATAQSLMSMDARENEKARTGELRLSAAGRRAAAA